MAQPQHATSEPNVRDHRRIKLEFAHELVVAFEPGDFGGGEVIAVVGLVVPEVLAFLAQEWTPPVVRVTLFETQDFGRSETDLIECLDPGIEWDLAGGLQE